MQCSLLAQDVFECVAAHEKEKSAPGPELDPLLSEAHNGGGKEAKPILSRLEDRKAACTAFAKSLSDFEAGW